VNFRNQPQAVIGRRWAASQRVVVLALYGDQQVVVRPVHKDIKVADFVLARRTGYAGGRLPPHDT
jgi:hypothetical protein